MNTGTHISAPAVPAAHTTQIEALLDDYCRARIEDSREIAPGATRLWQEIHEYIRGGGKRLRPRLFLMLYEYYGGSDIDSVLPSAGAWELLHASLLVHDDIIDRDTIRHGKPNVAGRYNQIYSGLQTADAEHYALSAALLAGDLLLSSAFDIVNRSALADAQKIIMQRYLNEAIFAVGAGELIDTESALYPLASADPFSIATYKTASYSFEMPMKSGAMLAGAPLNELDKLGEIARHAGIAFQLTDDLLGVYGNSEATGKSNRSDIIEKKRTLLVQRALASAPIEAKQLIEKLYSKDAALTDEEAEEVYAVINGTPAKEEIETIIEDNTSAALSVVSTLAISESDKANLSRLIASLVGRSS